MDRIDRAVADLREMDELVEGGSPIHLLHPLAKLIVTILYILLTVSFGKYDLSGMIIMALYPALMLNIGGIPVRTCFYKLRFILPFVCAVGLFNPILDRRTLFFIGPVAVSGGTVSMITLMLKGILCLSASFAFAATTHMNMLCAALRKIRVPGIIVTLLLLTYRYVSLMMDEISAMTTAYKLRAPGQKGIRFSAWGSFLGQLLLRTMDRAGDLYAAMKLRGFHGEFRHAEVPPAKARDYVFVIGATAVLLLFRCFNIAEFIGEIALRRTI